LFAQIFIKNGILRQFVPLKAIKSEFLQKISRNYGKMKLFFIFFSISAALFLEKNEATGFLKIRSRRANRYFYILYIS